MTATDQPPVDEVDVLHRLSLLDRFLPAWIGVAMVLGLLLGAAIPQLDDWLDIAVGENRHLFDSALEHALQSTPCVCVGGCVLMCVLAYGCYVYARV